MQNIPQKKKNETLHNQEHRWAGWGGREKDKSQNNETNDKTNNSKTNRHNIEQATVESQHITNTPPPKKKEKRIRQKKLKTRRITVPRTPMGGVGWKRKAKQTTTKRYTKQTQYRTGNDIFYHITNKKNKPNTHPPNKKKKTKHDITKNTDGWGGVEEKKQNNNETKHETKRSKTKQPNIEHATVDSQQITNNTIAKHPPKRNIT